MDQTNHDFPWKTSTTWTSIFFSWAIKMVNTGKIDFPWISFLIAGHTSLHQIVFLQTLPTRARRLIWCVHYRRTEIIMWPIGHNLHIEDGTNILMWRDSFGEKYSNLPGVHKLHDFLFIKVASGVLMKMRDFCHGVALAESPLWTRNPEQSGTLVDTHKDKCWYSIFQDKKAHI